jgi:pimeloyl-ACP methyl ester carboxylesterase
MSQQWTLWYYDYRQIWNGWESSFNRSIINPVRPDGKDGIYLDWGLGAPYQDPFTGDPPTDKFAVQGRTTAQFESGKTYKFKVNTDDVVALLVVPLGGTLSDDNYLTPPQEWQNAKEPKEYIFTPQATGTYNVVFRYIDEAGDAFVDFSWEEQSLQSTLPTNPRPDFQETPSNLKFLTLRGDGNWNGENGGIEQRGTIRASSDVYDYRFTLGEPRRINIGLNELTADADIELWWKDGNNDRLIAKSDKPNTNVESISRRLEPGTYYVKVYPYGSASTNYNLRITELTGNIQENGLWRNYDEVDKYYKNGVNLYRFDQDGSKDDVGIDPGKNTILVVHGWTDSTETDSEGKDSPIKSLAKAAAEKYPDYQVLALDWRDPARNSTSDNRKDTGEDKGKIPYHAARSITPVAKWAVNALINLGINPDKLSIFGHSLGSHVGTEIGRIFNEDKKLGQLENFVALDPAHPINDYDLDGNTPGDQKVKEKWDFAKRSLALVGKEGAVGIEGLAGSSEGAARAQDSLVVDLSDGDFIPTASYHIAPVKIFQKALENNYLKLKENLALPNDRRENSYDDNAMVAQFGNGRHEGRIVAKSDGTIEKLEYVNRTGFLGDLKNDGQAWTS